MWERFVDKLPLVIFGLGLIVFIGWLIAGSDGSGGVTEHYWRGAD